MSVSLESLGYLVRAEPWLQVVYALVTLWALRTIPKNLQFFALTAALLALHLLMLIGTWRTGHTDTNTLFGIVPISDAQSYYEDAFAFTRGEMLGEISSRRPLFPVLLGGMLTICGNDLYRALIAITIVTDLLLAGFIICVTARYRFLGSYLALVGLLLFMNRFVGQTMTEQAGLAGGLLAAILYLRSFRAAALGALFAALLARVGAIAVVPLLLLWGDPRPRSSRVPTVWVAGLVSVLVAFGLHTWLATSVRDPTIPAFGNGSHSLYGVITGYRGWTAIYEDYPEIRDLSEQDAAPEIFSKSMVELRRNPLRAGWGAIRSIIDLPIRLFSFVRMTDPWRDLSAHLLINGPLYLILSLLFLAGSFQILRTHQDLWLCAIVAGLFLSAPIAPPIDSDGMRAYAATMPFTLLVLIQLFRKRELTRGSEKLDVTCTKGRAF